MSNLMNEEALLDAVAGCPWASAGEIAHHLGMDKSNTRRDLKKLCRDGKVIGRDDGGTLRFSLPGSSASPPEFPKYIGNSPQVIDGDFKVLSNGSQTPSTSRSLVPAAATFDSRLAGTLARNERARRLRSPQGQTMGQHVHFVEEDRFAARRRAEQEEAERAETPRNHVAELLAKAKKTAPKKEEPRAKTWGEWFAARFSTPSKPVLR